MPISTFWLGLKARSMKVWMILQNSSPRPGISTVPFRPKSFRDFPMVRLFSVTDDQVWQKQGDEWRLILVERTDAPRLKQPAHTKKNIYPADADAHAEIKEAEEKAAKEHKRFCWFSERTGASTATCSIWPFNGRIWRRFWRRAMKSCTWTSGRTSTRTRTWCSNTRFRWTKGSPHWRWLTATASWLVSQKNGEFEDARGHHAGSAA